MRSYQLKRGHYKNIEGHKLFEMVKESFGEANESGEKVSASFGALADITVWTDKKFLYVDTDMRKDVDDDTARQTIGAYNSFLVKATGFTAKQRAKKAQKDAKG